MTATCEWCILHFPKFPTEFSEKGLADDFWVSVEDLLHYITWFADSFFVSVVVDGTGKIGVKTSIFGGHPNYPAQIFGHDFISLESSMAAYRGLRLWWTFWLKLSPITIWLFNIAMENCQFFDGLPTKKGDFPWLCWITRGYIPLISHWITIKSH